MDELVNTLRTIQNRIREAGIELRLENECLHIDSPSGSHHNSHHLPLVRLYRPSSAEVKEKASPEKLLILTAASNKAVEAAAPFNHIEVPDGNFRLVFPGVALWRETPVKTPVKVTQTRLRGRSGTIAETLLLGGQRVWSVRELARVAGVAQSLAHRVLDRLEKENYLEVQGSGPEKTRTMIKPAAVAEAWSQEEIAPNIVLRGHLYGSSPEVVAQKLLQICPEGAIGGLMAANSYQPTLTRVPFPLRLWVPEGFWLGRFQEAGLEETSEGANVEIVQSKSDTWRLHRNPISLYVSPWRAWLEISHLTGRSGELAQELHQKLVSHFENGYFENGYSEHGDSEERHPWK